MEQLTKGTLLKAKDGSHYAIFSTYVELIKTNIQKRSEQPTEWFNSLRMVYGDSGEQKGKRNLLVADYELASKVDQELINSVAEKIADMGAQIYDVICIRNRLRLTEDAWKGVESFSSLIKETEEVEGTLKGLKKELQTVINLTAKDYVKGEYILEVIKAIMPLIESIKGELRNRENLKGDPSKVTYFMDPLDQ